MKMHRGEGHQSTLAEINIIPLVDVMLVLLIIFMVAAPMMQQGIDINLPEVNANATSSSKDDLVLSINANGQLFLGNDKSTSYSLDNLESKLQTVFEGKEKKVLFLRADEGVKYGYVVSVMAACQKAGVDQVGMITTPETTKSSK